jgi:predicted AAA+ superfamily ATPase
MINRLFNPSKKHSFFLFGARATGKTTALKMFFKEEDVHWVDLLDLELEQQISRRPSLFSEQLKELKVKRPKVNWVVIDEVQKVPELLNTVHKEIEEGRLLFAITGSSARKLKRGGANLLAGRAIAHSLFPLTHLELGESFDLSGALRWGTLPKVMSVSEELKADYLRTYANTYVKEEVIAEQLVRKVQPFRAFLEVAAQCAGQILNFSKIARDVGTDPVSVQSYFEILEDTLLGFMLKPFHESIRKRQRQNPKFYFFDLGVQNALARTLNVPLIQGSSAYGNAFEQFVAVEIFRLNSYLKKDWELSYLRTKDDAEIDLILDRPGLPRALIEIKSTNRIDESYLRNIQNLGAAIPHSDAFCFSQDPIRKKLGNVTCLPWQEGFVEIGLTGKI